MKVLFLNPSRAGGGNIPLNIPLLISILKRHNHQVRLFDLSDYAIFDIRDYEEMFFKKADFDEEKVILDRKNFYKDEFGKVVGGCNLKKTDYHLDFVELLNNFRPQVIAVSCLSIDFRFTREFLLPFKEKYKIPVIFGGIHAILSPEEVLNSGVCDFVCLGEGENSFPQLLEALENNTDLKKIKGFWFINNSKLIRNAPTNLTDLGTLPIPDFEHFDPIHFYRPFDGKRYKMLNYELTRGCLFNCAYCVNGVLKEKYKGLGKYYRFKNIEQSIKELKFLRDKYNFEFIRFWDEDFTSLDTGYLADYAKEYLAEINLPFLIYARVDTVTEQKVKLLKEMGCRTFAMGIESGDEFIRNKIMNRNIPRETIIRKFNLVKSYGIRVSAYNIIGLPYETRERIFETIKLNREVNPDSFSVTLLEPYKGTPIRKICEEQGLNPNHETVFGRPQFIPKGMTYNELNGLYRTFPFYIRFPEKRYDEIGLAESDNSTYQKLKAEFNKIK